MADIPSFKLSKNPILQGLLILAIFLSGYFLYLLTGYGFGVDHNEIEIFFNVLVFGVIVVGVIFLVIGRLSVMAGHGFVNDNIYAGPTLHVLIFFSALFSVFYHLEIITFPPLDFLGILKMFNIYIYNFLEVIFIFIVFILIFSWFYKWFYKKFLEKHEEIVEFLLVNKLPDLRKSIEVKNLEQIKKIRKEGDVIHKFEDRRKIVYFSRNYNLIEKKYHCILRK